MCEVMKMKRIIRKLIDKLTEQQLSIVYQFIVGLISR